MRRFGSSTSPVRSSHSQTVEHGNGTLELLLTFSLYLIDISIAIPLPGRTANGFAYRKKKKNTCSFTHKLSLHLNVCHLQYIQCGVGVGKLVMYLNVTWTFSKN